MLENVVNLQTSVMPVNSQRI